MGNLFQNVHMKRIKGHDTRPGSIESAVSVKYSIFDAKTIRYGILLLLIFKKYKDATSKTALKSSYRLTSNHWQLSLQGTQMLLM